MKIHFIGHAALLITYNNSKILVDPVLNWIGSLLLVNNLNNNKNNQKQLTVDEIEIGTMFQDLDAVLYTNPFVEKIEKKAFKVFANTVPILCKPKDEHFFNNLGFRYVTSISEVYEIKSLKIQRFQLSAKKFFSPESCGFMLKQPNEPTIFFTGNSPYDDKLKNYIKQEQPDLTIFNNLAKSKAKNYNSSQKFINEIEAELSDIMVVNMNMETGNHYILSKKNLQITLNDNLCAINFLPN